MQLENYIPNKYLINDKIEFPENINTINIGFEPNSFNRDVLLGLNDSSTIFNSDQYKKLDFNEFINTRFFILPFALSNYSGFATFYNIKNKISSKTGNYEN